MSDEDRKGIGASARHLVRASSKGGLATVMRETGGAPYASFVAVASDHDGSPVLLLSDLADHTRNLKADDRVSLLLVGESDHQDPLAGERLTLQGRLAKSDLPSPRERYLARHEGAALYADFADFGFYRLTIERAHLVAGFGRIHWIDGEELTIRPAEALIQAERGMVEHMNDDHTDAIQLYATRLLGQGEGEWRMTGIDPEGADLRFGNQSARLPFAIYAENSTDVRQELIRLVNEARNA